MPDYKATDKTADRQSYIIEKAIPIDEKTQLDFGWIAYRQDPYGWENKKERVLHFGKTIADTINYLSLHYPNATCAGIWPIGEWDGDARTAALLDNLGIEYHRRGE